MRGIWSRLTLHGSNPKNRGRDGQVRIQDDRVGCNRSPSVVVTPRSPESRCVRHSPPQCCRPKGDPCFSAAAAMATGIACIPPREVDPGDGIHVGDDGVDRERVERRHPAYIAWNEKPALSAGILEELVDLWGESTESTNRCKTRKVRGQKVERRVDIPVDEVVHLKGVELTQWSTNRR